MNLNSFERVIIRLDGYPWSALYRFAIGFLTFAAWERWRTAQPAWTLFLLFLCILVLLRLLPAICRLALPFSNDASNVWLRRRNFGRFYDSYQWQKLFWIGLGMAGYLLFHVSRQPVEFWLTTGCLVGGAIGIIVYRRIDPEKLRTE